jgi:hypothetical protein
MHSDDVTAALLGDATYNLDIARQYIDEARHLDEHRIISFHYGVALLADCRNRPPQQTGSSIAEAQASSKLALAAQCFLDVTNWGIRANATAAEVSAYERIIAEAHYNLGVIQELQGHPKLAEQSYEAARAIAEAQSNRFEGVAILSRFGSISAQVASLDANSPAGQREDIQIVIMKLMGELEDLDGRPAAKGPAPEPEEISPQAKLAERISNFFRTGRSIAADSPAPHDLPEPQPAAPARPRGKRMQSSLLRQMRAQLIIMSQQAGVTRNP